VEGGDRNGSAIDTATRGADIERGTLHADVHPPAASRRRAMTPLDKPLRRELQIDGAAYTLTLDPETLKLVRKGHRKGLVLRWTELVNGDAALATALQASLAAR
jgi:hypothetical protein